MITISGGNNSKECDHILGNGSSQMSRRMNCMCIKRYYVHHLTPCVRNRT